MNLYIAICWLHRLSHRMMAGAIGLLAILQAAPPVLAEKSASDITNLLSSGETFAKPSAAGAQTALRARAATADLSKIDRLSIDGSGSLRLNLFDDAVFTARCTHLDTVSTPSTDWSGTLEGETLGCRLGARLPALPGWTWRSRKVGVHR